MPPCPEALREAARLEQPARGGWGRGRISSHPSKGICGALHFFVLLPSPTLLPSYMFTLLPQYLSTLSPLAFLLCYPYTLLPFYLSTPAPFCASIPLPTPLSFCPSTPLTPLLLSFSQCFLFFTPSSGPRRPSKQLQTPQDNPETLKPVPEVFRLGGP